MPASPSLLVACTGPAVAPGWAGRTAAGRAVRRADAVRRDGLVGHPTQRHDVVRLACTQVPADGADVRVVLGDTLPLDQLRAGWAAPRREHLDACPAPRSAAAMVPGSHVVPPDMRQSRRIDARDWMVGTAVLPVDLVFAQLSAFVKPTRSGASRHGIRGGWHRQNQVRSRRHPAPQPQPPRFAAMTLPARHIPRPAGAS